MLSPRIREGESFRMTIESRGQEFTFEGYLTETEIKAESDDSYATTDMMARVMPRRLFTVDLSIQVVGDVTQTALPKKAKHVQ